jgi:uncharacterized protein (TIGR02246 family)
MRVVNARDLDGYASLVTEDVVWIPPGQPPVEGRAAFTAWLRPFFERYEYEFRIEPIASSGGDDHLCERARFHTSLRAVGGGPAMDHGGICIVFWRRDTDGVWHIERYVDEADLVG